MPFYNKGKLDIMNSGVSGATNINVALLTSAYTPNIDTDDFFNDVSSFEVSVTGYVAGGKRLSGVTKTQDNTNDKAKFDANDLSWTITGTLTYRTIVIYRSTGTASTSPLIGYITFGSDQGVTNNTHTLVWDSNGIFRF